MVQQKVGGMTVLCFKPHNFWKHGRDFQTVPMENFYVSMGTQPIPYVAICKHYSVVQD